MRNSVIATVDESIFVGAGVCVGVGVGGSSSHRLPTPTQTPMPTRTGPECDQPTRTPRQFPIGVAVLYLFDERPVPELALAAAALGAVLTSAVRQAVAGRL